MRSVVVQGELPPSDLVNLLATAGVEDQGTASYVYGNVRVLLCVGRRYFLRSNDFLGAVLLATTDGSTQRIDVCSAGAGSGLLGIQLGAGQRVEGDLLDAVLTVARERSLACQEIQP